MQTNRKALLQMLSRYESKRLKCCIGASGDDWQRHLMWHDEWTYAIRMELKKCRTTPTNN